MRALTVKLARAWSPEELISRVGKWLKPNLGGLKDKLNILHLCLYFPRKKTL